VVKFKNGEVVNGGEGRGLVIGADGVHSAVRSSKALLDVELNVHPFVAFNGR
jgi:2-polyprenyl-6-methoxyphenol hydroxylase-like FAD-dependent oxidoreductase